MVKRYECLICGLETPGESEHVPRHCFQPMVEFVQEETWHEVKSPHWYWWLWLHGLRRPMHIVGRLVHKGR